MAQTRVSVSTPTLTERISGLFWTTIEVVGLFVMTLINPEAEDGGQNPFVRTVF